MKKSAENAVNSPSRKGMYQEKMPEAVKGMKKYK
ncbi:MAG: cyclic lactone autoinducer peptide [Solobacterium sp.]|nr:cyclic lactone autoinducer peptide [Solobacterium sp.]